MALQTRRPHLPPLACALACVALAGCATTAGRGEAMNPSGAAAQQPSPDPLEPTNRRLFGLGQFLDKTLVRPIAMGYRRLTPRPIRKAVHNVLQNLDEPVVLANDLLQGRLAAGARTTTRFALNSTVGIAGTFDPARRAGIPHHDNGFADTLGRYGVTAGPYLYVPVVGPSSVRDLIGAGVDIALDPLTWTQFHHSQTVSRVNLGLTVLDSRTAVDRELRNLKQTATDPYATIRSVYLQKRAADIRGGEAAIEDLPDLPGEGAPTSTPAPAQAAPPAR